jgi:hypothetical protein
MYSVMRHYQGQNELAAELKKHGKEIEKLMSGVPGFIAYYLIHNSEGTTAVTVCDNRKGCDESTKLAADWLHKNLPNLKLNPPRVVTGEVQLAFDRTHAAV